MTVTSGARRRAGARIRDLLDAADLEDPHEFAEAFVRHTAQCATTQSRATDVTIALHQWVSDGRIGRSDLVFSPPLDTDSTWLHTVT